jgi:hypothetical protein
MFEPEWWFNAIFSADIFAVAVLERIPVFARFDILDFIDLGGDLNIKVTLDTSEEDEIDEEENQKNPGLLQEVYICVSKDRQPKLVTH